VALSTCVLAEVVSGRNSTVLDGSIEHARPTATCWGKYLPFAKAVADSFSMAG